MRYLAYLLVGATSLIGTTASADVDYRNDGSVRLGNHVYPTREAYHTSAEFIASGARCGTPAKDPAIMELIAKTDCGMNSTTVNPDYPLVRYATGDLSAVLPGACPTGRTNLRIRGWLGRADQSTKVRGMFVHASQVAEIVRRHPEIGRARLVVEGEMADDRMTLRAESESAGGQALAERVAASIREVTKLRGAVVLVAPGSLPNDGKVIEDLRAPA